MTRITAWLRTAWRRAQHVEPARLRAVWVALVAVAATAGISVSADLDAKVTAIIGALAIILPLIQGESTRSAVYSPATVDKLRDEPGEGDY